MFFRIKLAEIKFISSSFPNFEMALMNIGTVSYFFVPDKRRLKAPTKERFSDKQFALICQHVCIETSKMLVMVERARF